MGGCDKTTPALLMGAISMNLPAIFMPAGPMLRGNWRGQSLGRGSDVWKYWAEKRAGNLTDEQWREIEDGIARSPGHCMTMGTASTMTSAAEALGFTLPGAASIPAADSRHARMATRDRPAHRRHGVGGPEAARLRRPRPLRQRDHDGARARRLDQRDRAPGRDRAPRRHRRSTLDRFDALARTHAAASPTSARPAST